MTTEVPAEFAFSYQGANPGASAEDMLNAYKSTQSSPPGNESVKSDPPSGISLDKFGVSSEDELMSKVSRATELEAKVTEMEKQLGLLDYVKDPFANDYLRNVNTFTKTTGISDMNLASEFVNATEESFIKDPIKAIAMDMMLKKPQLAQMGISEVMQSVAEKFQIDLDYYDPSSNTKLPALLKLEAAEAAESLIKNRQELLNNNNFFVDLQTKAKEQEDVIARNQQAWEQLTPGIMSGFKQISSTIDTGIDGVGQIDLSLAVSEQEVAQAIDNLKLAGYLNNINPNDDGVNAVKQAVENTLWLTKRKEIIQESIKAAEGKMREHIIKSGHNIGPVTANRVGQQGQQGQVLSPAEEAYKNWQTRK